MTTDGLASVAPPHDEEAEASVLGAVLLADKWMHSLVSDAGLVPEDFYRPRHREIYKAMQRMHARGASIDTLTIADELGKDLENAGGKDYIETLVTRIPAIGNTPQYGQIVKENSHLRQLVAATQLIQESVAAREGDPYELIENAQRVIGDVGEEERTSAEYVSEFLHEEIDKIEAAGKRTDPLTGVTTGLRELDEILHGLQKGNLVVVGGRPSMGKSALVSTVADAAASSGVPTFLFTMEMDRSEVSQRLLASRARLRGSQLRTGDLEAPAWSKLMEAGQGLAELPLIVDDASSQTVTGIRAKVHRASARRVAKEQAPIGLVIIDYLQMLRSEDVRMPRTYQVEEQTRALKRMARDLNLPVVILSQLSREVERRSPPIPQLSDLKDSGSIEQDADVVVLLYREDYYRADSERPDEADLIVAKHRGGETGTVEVLFKKTYPAFGDLPIGLTREKEKRPLAPSGFVAGRDDPGEGAEPVF